MMTRRGPDSQPLNTRNQFNVLLSHNIAEHGEPEEAHAQLREYLVHAPDDPFGIKARME